ncbi:CoA pyrophosphatase [Nitrospinae bacterium]|nr:CoA pyrophosphatase [Nitrospinota bacterium]
MDLFLIKHKLKNDFPLVREATQAHPQRAAVMVMFYPRDNKTHVLMTKRSLHLKYHAGEISFPGGVFEEDEDDDLLATALRETNEELDIAIDPRDVFGQLPIVNTRLGFEITPFVSVLPSAPEYEPAESEVGEVLEIPFTTLLSTEQRDVGSKPSDEGVIYWFRHHRVWGASAKILNQIGHLARY